jgi:hypothetical protein
MSRVDTERRARFLAWLAAGNTFAGADGEDDPAAAVADPAADPAAEPEAPTYDWGEHAEHDLVKRHGGDPAKILQSFESLQREFHARNAQPAPEPEPDPEPYEPLQGYQVPAGVDQEFLGRVGSAFQLDPVGTLAELVAGGDGYVQYASMVYDALEESVGKFRAQTIYQQILRDQQNAEWQSQLEAQVAEQVTPLQQEATLAKIDAGLELVQAGVPKENWPKFEAYLASVIPPEGIPAKFRENPQVLKAYLQQVYDYWEYTEQKALNAAAEGTPPAPVPARRGAQSALNGNTASRPEDETEAQRIKRSVRETKIRVTD